MTVVTGNGTAVSGLGGSAGFGEIMLSRADDASLRVDVSAVFENGFQLGPQLYSGNDLYVSTNGLVSFGGAINGVVAALTSINRPFIAAFHADVDTRLDGEGAESGPVWVDVDPIADVVTITWQEVGFYRRNASYTNTFQLQLYDQGEDGISIVLRYDTITWTTGDLQNGWQGLGGDPALIGWRMAASGAINNHWATGNEGRLLALPGTVGNTGQTGLWVYTFVPPKVIYGTASADILLGDLGDDLLYGGAGNDRLTGLTGADAFFGGDGFDTVDYAQSATAVTVNLANPGANRGAAALGDSYTSIEGLIGSAFADHLTGTSGANRLEGGAGHDWISDAAGNDTVLGGDGNDTLAAGAGADFYYGGNGTDMVDYASAPTGIRLDLRLPDASTGIAAGDRLSGIEIISGSAFGDTLLGGNAADRFLGAAGHDLFIGRNGADSLYGGAGNDTLSGDAGADLLYGGIGWDMTSYGRAGTAVTVDLSRPSDNRGADALGDRFSGIEAISGSAFDDRLLGNSLGNTLYGQDGDDRLTGRAGNDTLYGGNGDDRLEGGTGGDHLYGGVGRDLVSYANATAAVRANLAAPTDNLGEARGDRYFGIEDVLGSNHDDSLTGNGTSNRLYGGAGDDALQGAGGADRLYGGAGFDMASYSGARTGLRASLARPQANTGDAAGDTYSSIEGLRGSSFADDLTGNGASNLLVGAGGADRLYGGSGNDTLAGGTAADRLSGGEGRDLASYAAASAAVYAKLSDPSANLGEARGDSYDSIEGLLGSAHNDTLTGSMAADWIYGSAGDDALLGGRGADQLYGGSGNDSFTGGSHGDRLDGGAGTDRASYSNSLSGVTVSLATPSLNTGDAAGDRFYGVEGLLGSRFNDRLYGDATSNRLEGDLGNDRLSGSGGADILEGGSGRDTLTGGTGADIFLLRRITDGGDVVTDYDPTQGDTLQLTVSDLSRSDISLRVQNVAGLGDANRAEVEILHRGTGQVLFTLQDGAGLTDIFLRIGSTSYDLL